MSDVKRTPPAAGAAGDDAQALAHLRSLARFGVRLGLERMAAILGALGQPHRAFASVHIAGTNGKGSTAAMLASIARAAGLRVGLYTSPHLVRFHERMVVDDQPISPTELVVAYRAVLEAVTKVAPEEPPTQFEFATAMAFWHFARAGVELAVVEVGLGGRLDATNVLVPELSVITPLALDHTAVLGTTLEAIAAEKAGIVKPGVEVVSAAQAPEAAAVVADRCRMAGAPLWQIGMEYRIERATADRRGGRFDLVMPAPAPAARCRTRQGPRRWGGLTVGLLGRHQIDNAAVAAAVADRLAQRGWAIDEEAVRRGLSAAQWPGRLQWIPSRPPLVLDGAHNPAAAAALGQSLRGLVGGAPVAWVLGMLAEKDVEGILDGLALDGGDHAVATRASESRSAPMAPEELARRVARRGIAAQAVAHPAEALEVARRLAGDDGVVCVTGSLYLVGEVLGLLGARAGEGIDTRLH